MKFVILLFIVSTALASDDGWKEISEAIVTKNQCSNEAIFENLFELSNSGQFTGTAQIQYLAEANEKSFLNCPEEFLSTLIQTKSNTRKEVLRNFGIVHAPWDIAKALTPLKEHKLYRQFISENFAGFFRFKEPKNNSRD